METEAPSPAVEQTETNKLTADVFNKLLLEFNRTLKGSISREDEQHLIELLKTHRSQVSLPELVNVSASVIMAETRYQNEELDIMFDNLRDFVSNLQSIGLVTEDQLLEGLDEDVLHSLELIDKTAFMRKRIRIITKKFYEQQKYNLLCECPEGFASLIEFLLSDVDSDVQGKIEELIGYFDLDPNKVIDVAIECLAFNMKPQIIQEIVRIYPADRINKVMLRKMADADCQSSRWRGLFSLAALLIKSNVMQAKEIWDILHPTDETLVELFSARKEAAYYLVQNKFELRFFEDDEEEKEAEAQTKAQKDVFEKDIRNQKVYFLEALIKYDFISSAYNLAAEWWYAIDFRACKYLNEAFCSLIDHFLTQNSNFASLPDDSDYFKGNSASFSLNSLEKISSTVAKLTQPSNNINEFLEQLQILMKLSNTTIHMPQSLIYRIIDTLVSTVNTFTDRKFQAVFIASEYLLPLILSQDVDPQIFKAIWELLKHLDQQSRFDLYDNCLKLCFSGNAYIIFKSGEVADKTKKFFRAYCEGPLFEATNATNFNRLYTSNPFVVFLRAIQEVRMYDNAVGQVIVSLNNANELSLDICLFAALREILNPDRKKFDENLEFQKWYSNLADLIAQLLKQFPSLEVMSVFKYIGSILLTPLEVSSAHFESKIIAAHIFKCITEACLGFKSIQTLTKHQKESFAGGYALKATSLQFWNFPEIFSTSGNRLISNFSQHLGMMFTETKSPDSSLSDECISFELNVYWGILLGLLSLKNGLMYDWQIESIKPVSIFNDMVRSSVQLMYEFKISGNNEFSKIESMIRTALSFGLNLTYEDALLIARIFFKDSVILDDEELVSEVADSLQKLYSSSGFVRVPSGLNCESVSEKDFKKCVVFLLLEAADFYKLDRLYDREKKNLLEKIKEAQETVASFLTAKQSPKISFDKKYDDEEGNEEEEADAIPSIPTNFKLKDAESKLQTLNQLLDALNEEKISLTEWKSKRATKVSGFLNSLVVDEPNDTFWQLLLLPRVVTAPQDSLFCSQIVQVIILNHSRSLAEYSEKAFAVFERLVLLVNTLTEFETDNLSLFLYKTIKLFKYLKKPEKLLDKYESKRATLKTLLSQESNETENDQRREEDLKSLDEISSKFDSLILLCADIYKRAGYLGRKNMTKVLHSCSEVFPLSKDRCQLYVDLLKSLKAEISQFDDLKVISVSYKTLLMIRLKDIARAEEPLGEGEKIMPPEPQEINSKSKGCKERSDKKETRDKYNTPGQNSSKHKHQSNGGRVNRSGTPAEHHHRHEHSGRQTHSKRDGPGKFVPPSPINTSRPEKRIKKS